MIVKQQALFFLDMETLCRRWVCGSLEQPLREWLLDDNGGKAVSLQTEDAVLKQQLLQFRWGHKWANVRADKAWRLPLYTVAEYYLLTKPDQKTEDIRKQIRQWHQTVSCVLAAQLLLQEQVNQKSGDPFDILSPFPDGKLPEGKAPWADTFKQQETLLEANWDNLEVFAQLDRLSDWLGIPKPVKAELGLDDGADADASKPKKDVEAPEKTPGKKKRKWKREQELSPLELIAKHVYKMKKENIAQMGNAYTYQNVVLDVRYGRTATDHAGFCELQYPDVAKILNSTSKRNDTLLPLYSIIGGSDHKKEESPAPSDSRTGQENNASANKSAVSACWREMAAADLGWRLTNRLSDVDFKRIVRSGCDMEALSDEHLPELPRKVSGIQVVARTEKNAASAPSEQPDNDDVDFEDKETTRRTEYFHYRVLQPESHYLRPIALFNWPRAGQGNSELPSSILFASPDVYLLYCSLIERAAAKEISSADLKRRWEIAQNCLENGALPIPGDMLIENDLEDTLQAWQGHSKTLTANSLFAFPYKEEGDGGAIRRTICDDYGARSKIPVNVFNKQLVVYLLYRVTLDSKNNFQEKYNALLERKNFSFSAAEGDIFTEGETVSPKEKDLSLFRMIGLLEYIRKNNISFSLPGKIALSKENKNPQEATCEGFILFYRVFSQTCQYRDKITCPYKFHKTAKGQEVTLKTDDALLEELKKELKALVSPPPENTPEPTPGAGEDVH